MLPLLCTILALAAEPAPLLQNATLLAYRGSVARLDEQGEPGDPEKTFDLTLLVADADELAVFWLVDESGRGGWSWPERFGLWDTTAGDSLQRPALLYDHDSQPAVLPLAAPRVALPAAIAAAATFRDDELSYEALDEVEFEGRAAWLIQANNRLGRKRRMWVAAPGGVLLGYDERVFMGQGEEYLLRMRLESTRQVPPQEAEALAAAFEAAVALRNLLDRPPRSENPELSAAQLALLGQALPDAETAARGTLVEMITRAARRDLASQTARVDELARLAAAAVGRRLESFALEGLSGERLSPADLEGRITVLHFWDYRDEPLREPYGQVGYLDFLYDRRKGDGVVVYGVAVSQFLADDAARPAALRSARKLKSFMNLSYPILWDRGELLKQLGDPRLARGSLPLFVVIGPDARVAHFHAGHYQVDRDRGLVELSEAIDALERPRP